MNAQGPDRGTAGSAGFTLIELMIAMVLGLLVIAGIGAVFVAGSRTYREDERVSRVQENSRLAMGELTADLEMAGHWSELFFPPEQIPGSTTAPGSLFPMAATVDPADGSDCGPTGTQWKYDATPSIEIRDNVASGSAANGWFSCITAANFQPNTDIVAIKRVASIDTPKADLAEGTVYMRTNNSAGVLFVHPTSDSDAAFTVLSEPSTYWAYNVVVYYIRNYATKPGDGIPSLCREFLQKIDMKGDPGGCIPGIENMQLEAGIDSDGDGVPNFYRAAPTAEQFDNIVSLRVMLLARSVDPLGGYTNPKTYTLSNLGDITPGGPYPRRLNTQVVAVRNVAALNAYGAGNGAPSP